MVDLPQPDSPTGPRVSPHMSNEAIDGPPDIIAAFDRKVLDEVANGDRCVVSVWIVGHY